MMKQVLGAVEDRKFEETEVMDIKYAGFVK